MDNSIKILCLATMPYNWKESKISSKTNEYDDYYEMEHVESFKDKLPALVLEKIFKKLSQKSLFDFADAYPQYSSEILNPIYWRFLQINLSNLFLHHDDLLSIFMYLIKNVKHVSFKGFFRELR